MREKLALSNVVGGEHVDTVDVRRTNLMDPSSGEAGAAPVSGPEAVGRRCRIRHVMADIDS